MQLLDNLIEATIDLYRADIYTLTFHAVDEYGEGIELKKEWQKIKAIDKQN